MKIYFFSKTLFSSRSTSSFVITSICFFSSELKITTSSIRFKNSGAKNLLSSFLRISLFSSSLNSVLLFHFSFFVRPGSSSSLSSLRLFSSSLLSFVKEEEQERGERRRERVPLGFRFSDGYFGVLLTAAAVANRLQNV